MLKGLGGRGASVNEETLRFGSATGAGRAPWPPSRVSKGATSKRSMGAMPLCPCFYGIPKAFSVFAQGTACPKAGDCDFHGPSVISIRPPRRMVTRPNRKASGPTVTPGISPITIKPSLPIPEPIAIINQPITVRYGTESHQTVACSIPSLTFFFVASCLAGIFFFQRLIANGNLLEFHRLPA